MSDAGIEILEGRYFIGFWFVGDSDRDWLVVLRSADVRENIEKLAKAPWAHVRREP